MSEPLALFSLPLFPLDAVLFPDGVLALRIFEVRYLSMIAKCRDTGAPFGVVTLTKGHEVRQPGADAQAEAFADIGTLARITEFSAPQAGLMTVRCSGLQRFKISKIEHLKHGLWTADVIQLPRDQAVPIPDDLQSVSVALHNLIQSLQARHPSSPTSIQGPYLLDDCAWVANRWCELLPIASATKQRLMALDNPLLRLELVSDQLQRSGISS